LLSLEPSYETTKIVGDYKPSHAAISFCKLLLEKNFRKRPTAVEALNHPWLKQLNSNKCSSKYICKFLIYILLFF
jgi:serine/threonine protein kinase